MSITIHKGVMQHIHLRFLNITRRSPKRVLGAAFGSLQPSHEKQNFKLSPVQTRSQSTNSGPHNSEPHVATSWLFRGSSVRVSTLFTALLALGAGATALGLYVAYSPSNVPLLIFFQSREPRGPRANCHVCECSYEIYTSFTLWPVELRKDLRAGIRAKSQGNHALSERFLAWYV